MKILQKVSVKTINIFYLLLVVALFLMSLNMRCQVNVFNFARRIERQNPIVYFIMMLAFIVICLVVIKSIETLQKKIHRISELICILVFSVGVVLCIGWLFFYRSYPIYDQQILFTEAQKIVGYDDSAYYTEYFNMYKRQRLVVLIIALGLKIFGNNCYGFRLFNIIGAILLFIGIKKCADNVYNDKIRSCLSFCFICLFYPIVVYTSFLYGTLWAVTGATWGFYYTMRWVKERKNSSIILLSICFVLGISMHQSAAVLFVAASIYILLTATKGNIIKSLLAVVLATVLLMGVGKTVDIVYENITQISSGDTLPVLATVAMGITAETEDGGPGAQNGLSVNLYFDNYNSAKLTNESAVTIIKNAIYEYMTGQRRLSFFVDKTKYQWLDASFGARKIIICDENNSEMFISFYGSSIRDILFKLQHVVLITMYFLCVIASIYTLKNISIITPHFLFQLCVIGGFLFSLIWESLSRYCLPYYIWIVMEGIYGLFIIYSLIKNRALWKEKQVKC